MDDDIEIRKFYIKDCADRWGARVWCAVTAGPSYAVTDSTKWSVYHRPNKDEQWPANLVHVDSFDEALRIARDFAAAYRHEAAR